MAGVLIYPRGVGLLDEIHNEVDPDANVQAPPDVPILIGAYAITTDADGPLPPYVLIAVPLPDGRRVMAQVSLALFLTAADAFVLAHGDPRDADTCGRCGARLG